MSATEIIKNIKKKTLSCVEVMEAHLKQIDKVNPIINALEQILPVEEALRRASLADQAISKGKRTGKLHGLPITIKDAFMVKEFITSCGNEGIYKYNKDKQYEDATIVKRLKEEGAIILGMSNVPEMLICPESDNLLYGQTKNPYDLSRTSGGSSGGEAAIIASGGSPLGIGSDGGGSIRVPSHFSGIAGLKPTQFLVPNTGSGFGNALGILSSLVTNGPMARYVEDLILCLPIIAGPDYCDPHVMPVPLKSIQKVPLKSLRIAFYTDDGNVTPTKETQETVRNAAKSLGKEVKWVEENRPKSLEKTWPLVWEAAFLGGDGGKEYKKMISSFGEHDLSPRFQEFLQLAQNCKFSVTELRSRFKQMDQFRIDILTFFNQYDVIICPVVATPAKLHGLALKEIKDLTYTMSYNLAGCPGVVVRCGTSEQGLPIGVQILAKPWHDEVALKIAKKLEDIFGGWKSPGF